MAAEGFIAILARCANQSLAAGLIPINTWQHMASLPFKPGVLERKVYNNGDTTFFSILTFAKPECDNVLQHIITLRLGKCLYMEKNVLSSYLLMRQSQQKSSAFSSAEMFKKPLWQTVWTQGAVCSGSTLFASILNSSVMLNNYLQQKTSADDIFRCIFFLAV